MGLAKHSELAQKARFIFEGTVQKLGAATIESAPVTGKTLIVHINRIIQAPQALNTYIGKDITVQLSKSSRSKLKEGQEFIFYTNGWLFGKSIAVRAVGQLPVPQAERAMLSKEVMTPELTEPAPENLATQDLQQRVAIAQAVVTGRVREVRLPESQVSADTAVGVAKGLKGDETDEAESVEPISEHDPEWREAVIEIEGVEKGNADQTSVVIRFPSSDDVQWFRAPKLEAGQEGVFLLHNKQPATATADAADAAAPKGLFEEESDDVYTVLDPADFQPRQQLPVVKALIATEADTPDNDEQ